MTDNLLTIEDAVPCLFCGSKELELNVFAGCSSGSSADIMQVTCRACGACGPAQAIVEVRDYEKKVSVAVHAWNRRSDD